MGLFSRNEPAARPTSRRSPRGATSSEAQASELRGRARRRLIGALVLVIAAVIILPTLFNKPPDAGKTPTVAQVTIPAAPPANPAPASSAPSGSTQAGGAPGSASGGAVTQEPPLPAPQPVQPDTGSASSANPSDNGAATAPAPKPASKPAAPKAADKKPEKGHEPDKAQERRKPDTHEAQTRARAVDRGPGSKVDKVKRTDDGAVALALLQGRTPGQESGSSAGDHGRYVLQIAAYTTKSDADSRRSRLLAAGVTNAYVESASSGGKPTYRLRVGPFPTHEAAQAAQARLRALGYDNGFISSK
jgi:DedD protein